MESPPEPRDIAHLVLLKEIRAELAIVETFADLGLVTTSAAQQVVSHVALLVERLKHVQN